MRILGSSVLMHRFSRSVFTVVLALAAASCENCQTENRQTESRQTENRQELLADLLKPVPGDPIPHRGESLTPSEQQQVASLTTIVARYHPRWKRANETLDEYVQRQGNSPETQRLKNLIVERLRNDVAWRRFLDDTKRLLPENVWVRNGRPPFGLIPSYQITVGAVHPRGNLIVVFRLSFLAPVYDYYESIRDQRGRLLEIRLAPSAESAAIAAHIRRMLAKHYSDYRELPAIIGTTLVTDIGTHNLPPDEATLADTLFEDSRAW